MDPRLKKWFALATFVLVAFAVMVGEVFAQQPDPTAPQSEHLYYLENLVVVLASFFTLYKGIAHGFVVGANKQQMGGGS